MSASRFEDFRRRYGAWAVVTGASSGIGEAMAHELAARGLNLVLCARRASTLATLARRLADAHGVECRPLALDLATPGAQARLAAATEGLDVGLLVAAAGFGTSGPFLAGEGAVEHGMLALNCGAVLDQCHDFGARFAARGRGGIVLFSSVVAFQGTPGSAHYAATKAYVQTLAEGLHAEWRGLGVDVLAAAPGPVHTGFAERADLQMARAAQPAAVARATLAALGRRATVRPGWLSKLLGWSLATAPRPLRVRILGAVMGAMTAHQRREATHPA